MGTSSGRFIRSIAARAAIGLAAALSACGGGGYGGGSSMGSGYGGMGGSYAVTNLVADTSAMAAVSDPNLVNAWGVAIGTSGFAWVAADATSMLTPYDGGGMAHSAALSLVPGSAGAAAPSAVVVNGTADFTVGAGGAAAPSTLIAVGRSGTISGWSATATPAGPMTVYDGGSAGKVYTGAALASFSGANYLYVADIRNGHVDVFDRSFASATLPGGFVDPQLPAGYAPYAAAAVGSTLYVGYAKPAAGGRDAAAGAGLGIVDVFDSGGGFVKELAAFGALNAPSAMAMAPGNFGPLSNDLLVANAGDGRINAYDPATGAYAGTISDAYGRPIVIDGIHGIAFGNGMNAQPTNVLFFAAGPSAGTHGLFGRIDFH